MRQPVVASSCPGSGEEVGRRGWGFRVGDADAINPLQMRTRQGCHPAAPRCPPAAVPQKVGEGARAFSQGVGAQMLGWPQLKSQSCFRTGHTTPRGHSPPESRSPEPHRAMGACRDMAPGCSDITAGNRVSDLGSSHNFLLSVLFLDLLAYN